MASSTKRARAEEAPALDLSQPPKKIAEQLLSCLGADANEQSKEAKNLDQAMRLVRKELSARGSRQQRAAEQLGSQSALTMRGAALPSDVFEHVAAYIAPKHYGALMATQKAFLSAVQAPRLWRRALDASEGSAMNVNCKISFVAFARNASLVPCSGKGIGHLLQVPSSTELLQRGRVRHSIMLDI